MKTPNLRWSGFWQSVSVAEICSIVCCGLDMRPTRIGTTHLTLRIAHTSSVSSTRLILPSQVLKQGLVNGNGVGKKTEMQTIFPNDDKPERTVLRGRTVKSGQPDI